MSEQEWDERYEVDEALYGTAPSDFLRENAHFIKPEARVLCIGDGQGRNGVYLAQLGHRVVSLDQSGVGLTQARRLAAQRGVSIETWHIGLEHYISLGDPPEPWDALVAIFVHLEAELLSRVARELTRQCAANAVLLWESFSPAQRCLSSRAPQRERLASRADLEAYWSTRWRIDVRIVERILNEGKGHNGLGATLQAIGVHKHVPG